MGSPFLPMSKKSFTVRLWFTTLPASARGIPERGPPFPVSALPSGLVRLSHVWAVARYPIQWTILPTLSHTAGLTSLFLGVPAPSVDLCLGFHPPCSDCLLASMLAFPPGSGLAGGIGPYSLWDRCRTGDWLGALWPGFLASATWILGFLPDTTIPGIERSATSAGPIDALDSNWLSLTGPAGGGCPKRPFSIRMNMALDHRAFAGLPGTRSAAQNGPREGVSTGMLDGGAQSLLAVD